MSLEIAYGARDPLNCTPGLYNDIESPTAGPGFLFGRAVNTTGSDQYLSFRLSGDPIDTYFAIDAGAQIGVSIPFAAERLFQLKRSDVGLHVLVDAYAYGSHVVVNRYRQTVMNAERDTVDLSGLIEPEHRGRVGLALLQWADPNAAGGSLRPTDSSMDIYVRARGPHSMWVWPDRAHRVTVRAANKLGPYLAGYILFDDQLCPRVEREVTPHAAGSYELVAAPVGAELVLYYLAAETATNQFEIRPLGSGIESYQKMSRELCFAVSPPGAGGAVQVKRTSGVRVWQLGYLKSSPAYVEQQRRARRVRDEVFG
jgi:hypothetical protein